MRKSEGKETSETPTTENASLTGTTTGKSTGVQPLEQLKPCLAKAWCQRMEAERRWSDKVDLGGRGDRKAYELLRHYGAEDDTKLPKKDTWLRYVREARLITEGRNPRRGRPHGKSIASAQ